MNNTSDANKPVSTAQQAAIDSAVSTLNTAINGKASSSHTHASNEISFDDNKATYVTGSNVKMAIESIDSSIDTLYSNISSKVPTSRTVNGKALSSNITLSASDVGSYTKAEVDSALAGKQAAGNYAGSSSNGGSATSAVKLDTSTAGSATQPVYFSGGKPVACTYTLGKSVPSNAVFTDTTYSAITNDAIDSICGASIANASEVDF